MRFVGISRLAGDLVTEVEMKDLATKLKPLLPGFTLDS
ncbi:hypothetical protein AK812_SmicGene46030, partial [Symbiodinium microadriaticum]